MSKRPGLTWVNTWKRAPASACSPVRAIALYSEDVRGQLPQTICDAATRQDADESDSRDVDGRGRVDKVGSKHDEKDAREPERPVADAWDDVGEQDA